MAVPFWPVVAPKAASASALKIGVGAVQARREKTRAIETIVDRADFLKIQNSGRKWVSTSVILQICGNDLDVIRLGFTVSKKVHKSAVIRNRIKRRLRAVAADVLTAQGKPGLDYVLVGREVTAEKPYHMIVKDLIWCLKKTGTDGGGV